MYRFRYIQFIGLIFLFSCDFGTRTDIKAGPQKRLEGYISKSFSINKVEDRRGLEDYLTGPTKTRLTSWSDDQFKSAFVDSKRIFKNLLIRDVKEVSEKVVSITYELTYIDQKSNAGAKVTSRKVSQMTKLGGIWYISEVRNIKEMIEYTNELSLP